MSSGSVFSANRRLILKSCAVAAITPLSGCCSRAFPVPEIDSPPPTEYTKFLKPSRINKSVDAPKFCIDAHAHFFNASDVPVKGFLEGPVAHGLDEPLKGLVRALAPLADILAGAAVTAKDEYQELIQLSTGLAGMTKEQVQKGLAQEVESYKENQSKEIYKILQGTSFEERYNLIQANNRSRNPRVTKDEYQRLSDVAIRNSVSLKRSKGYGLDEDYADGIVAFVFYMLSKRWVNLHTYTTAFSSRDTAFGVDSVYGALVDFDRWLDCPPRSSHEDQIRLHWLLSQLSDGYMRPLVAYNPWTDIEENGKSLQRALAAVDKYKFAGIKIYPPNGFLPHGNSDIADIHSCGTRPSGKELDRVLETFWEKCVLERENPVPIMAHTAESMGCNDDYEKLGGPPGWEPVLKLCMKWGKTPKINFGHFGGDTNPDPSVLHNKWTQEFAALMRRKEGRLLYGDLGIWTELRCNEVQSTRCNAAISRLKEVMSTKLNDSEDISSRVMYGSDWLMLSKERNWFEYPHEVASSLKSIPNIGNVFGANADKFYS